MDTSRFREIVVINGARIAHELSLSFQKLPSADQRMHFGGAKDVGWFYLYRNIALHPDAVLESVVSPVDQSSIVSTYKNHAFFGNVATLITARRDLIAALSKKLGLSAESIGVEDPARGRTLGVTELSTGQLIDILHERAGFSVMETDSHAPVVPD